jgi:hypothetical protein
MAVLCPSGSLCPMAGTSAPVLCPTASYNPSVGMTACLACTATGAYCPVGATSQSLCPTGSYCPTAALRVDCPAGLYNPIAGQTSIAACSACPAGKYAPLRVFQSLTTVAGMWYAGTVNGLQVGLTATAANSGADFVTVPGGHAFTGAVVQINNKWVHVVLPSNGELWCSIDATGWARCDHIQGIFNSGFIRTDKYPSGVDVGGQVAGFSACLPCAIGSYAPSIGSSKCTSCPFGSACGGSGLSVATPCSSGRYAPPPVLQTVSSVSGWWYAGTVGGVRIGLTTALTSTGVDYVTAPVGRAMTGTVALIDGGWTNIVLTDLAGDFTYWCSDNTGSKYSSCNQYLGVYDDNFVQTDRYISAVSLTGTRAYSTCLPCPVGSYCGSSGLAVASLCASGLYQPLTGQSTIDTCLSCVAGTYSVVGASACIPCSPGNWCPTASSISQASDFAGVVQSLKGLPVGLVLWLDGADPAGTGTRPSSGTLSNWVDKSGTGNHATGGISPTYSSTRGAVLFNGPTQYLTTTLSASVTTETLFCVVNPAPTTSAKVPLTILGPSASAGRIFGMETEASTMQVGWSVWGTPGVANTGFLRLGLTVLSGVNNVGTVSTYVGGVEASSRSSGFVPAGGRTTNIGAGIPGVQNFAGAIHEILVFSTALNDTQRLVVDDYLAAKWTGWLATRVIPCSAGSYATGNATACTLCPFGSFCLSGSASPTRCVPGTYSGELGKSECSPCGIGFFQSSGNASACQACNAGSFNSWTGSTACQACPAGYVCKCHARSCLHVHTRLPVSLVVE